MADVKISGATPAGLLLDTDMVPIARVGTDQPMNTTLADFATYVTVLASTHPPGMSNQPPTSGTSELYARSDHVHPTDTSRAPIASPQFTGQPTAPTMLPSDSSNALATTKFVHDLAAGGTLHTQTPGIDDNSELVATTEFVINQGSTDPPLVNGIVTAGVSRRFARGDHTHPVDTSRYAASNPSGFVNAAGAAAAAPVQSVAGRTGAISLAHTDITDWAATLAPYALTGSVPAASTTTPNMDGSAVVGTGTTWARADHVHPVDTSRYATTNPSGYQTAAQVTTIARTGTTTNDNAAAGQIGEFISASVMSPGVVASNAAVLNVATISLTAGDWDVQGQVGTVVPAATKIAAMSAWPSTTSATFPTTPQGGLHQVDGMVTQGGDVVVLPTGRMRISLAATTTVYLSAMVTFAGGTLACTGYIGARRMR
jgi:hypothetical protein